MWAINFKLPFCILLLKKITITLVIGKKRERKSEVPDDHPHPSEASGVAESKA